jgi:hypothetical protein
MSLDLRGSFGTSPCGRASLPDTLRLALNQVKASHQILVIHTPLTGSAAARQAAGWQARPRSRYQPGHRGRAVDHRNPATTSHHPGGEPE